MTRVLVHLVAALLFAAPPVCASGAAQRVVSLNPSLSEILVALGASEVLVGVDVASQRQLPELAGLPSVGGLFDPSLEAVVALRPDLVVLVPSVEQRDFHDRLVALGVRTVRFPNLHFEQVLGNIEQLGALVGRSAAAARRVGAIRAARRAVERAVAPRESVSCLVVLQHAPIFVAGADSFLDEMVTSAGCDNLGRQLGAGYPRASLEWVIDGAPEVILDMSLDAEGEEVGAYWRRLPAIPAVANQRVERVDAERVTMPGPALDEALRALALALHGPAVDVQIDSWLAGAGQ